MSNPETKLASGTGKLNFLDLYLIHWPVSLEPGDFKLPWDKDVLVPMDFKSTWEAMEEFQELGLAKAIGVSNFSCANLDTLLSTTKTVPAANQYSKNKGIHVCGYSPLGGYRTPWGTNDVLGSEVLENIAESKGKSVAQVCLRWLSEQGVNPVVKSFNVERKKANLQIFDWALTDDAHWRIDELPQRRINDGLDYISSTGPYKSLKELWDNDV